MSEGHERESGRGGLVWVLVVVAFVPLLYVLSVGPVGAITKNNPNALPAVQAFYSPVRWLHDHTPLKKPLEAYVNLWGFH